MLSVEALVQTPAFVGLKQQAVAPLWALGESSQHKAGGEIFGRGTEAREMLVIESGSVELFFPLPILGATKDVVVERLGPGDVLAWSALIRPFALTLSAHCIEDCCLRAFARETLQAYLAEHPDAGYALMQNLAAVVGHRLQHFQDLWIREVQTRIVGLLG